MSGTRWGETEWQIASDLLYRRARGKCEACGQPLVGNSAVRHHRQRRAVGGDRLSNLVLLHDGCHKATHDHPQRSRDLGLIVSVYVEDPGTVPMVHPHHGVVVLTDEGGVLEVALSS